jgi:hypothetical protein
MEKFKVILNRIRQIFIGWLLFEEHQGEKQQ